MSSCSTLIHARGLQTRPLLLTTIAHGRSTNRQTAAVHQVPPTAVVAAQESLTDDGANRANVHGEHKEGHRIQIELVAQHQACLIVLNTLPTGEIHLALWQMDLLRWKSPVKEQLRSAGCCFDFLQVRAIRPVTSPSPGVYLICLVDGSRGATGPN